MTTPLRVLIVEDRLEDAELMVWRLERDEFALQWQRVDTEAGYLAALAHGPDLILADWRLPQFSGLRALDLMRERGLDIPFIIVSGSIGEEPAVEAMRQGVYDYVLKDRPARLPQAVRHALEAKRLRDEQRRAEQLLRESEERFRRLAENAQDVIHRYEFFPRGRYTYISPAVTAITGYTPEEFYADPDLAMKIIHPEDFHVLEMLSRGGPKSGETVRSRCIRKDGQIVWLEQRSTPIYDETGNIIAVEGIARDITQRVQAEKEIQRRAAEMAALYRASQQIAQCALDQEQVCSAIHQAVAALIPTEAFVIALWDEARQRAEAVYLIDKGGRWPARVIPSGKGLTYHVITTGQALRLDDIAGDDNLTSMHFGYPEHVRSVLAVPLRQGERIIGMISAQSYRPKAFSEHDQTLLETLAGLAATALENTRLYEDAQRANRELAAAYDATIEGWSRVVSLRDQGTEAHMESVTSLTLRLAQAMGMGGEEIVHVRRGALLHDIGKMGVPESILDKPGKLTPDEWEVIRKHPPFAYDMLYPIAYLRPALDIPYCHHEKWDGTGYPCGLKGEEIPLAARIFAVVDVWDALTRDRPYRPAWSREQALAYIREQAGKQFDPQVVEAFLRIIGQEQPPQE